jgi:hypothetical protein
MEQQGRPYGSVNEAPKTGHVGGSVFAQRRVEKERAEAEAAKAAAAQPAANNVQTTLDPYNDPRAAMLSGGAHGQTATPGSYAPAASQASTQNQNPFGGLMKVIGDKAQKDIGTVMAAMGGRPQQQAPTGQSAGACPCLI